MIAGVQSMPTAGIGPAMLWADDHVDKLAGYAEAFRREGFTVHTASTSEQAIHTMKTTDIEFSFIDLKLGKDSGVELLQQLNEMKPECDYTALSGYLYLETYQQALAALSFEVRQLDKSSLPPPDDPEFSSFVRNIVSSKRGTCAANDRAAQAKSVSGRGVTVDPFALPLDAYVRMSPSARRELIELARRRADGVIASAFRDGKTWVVLCGSASKIQASGTNAEDALTSAQVIERFGNGLNRVPFRFMAPVQVDDLSSEGCSNAAGLKHYPTARVSLDDKLDLTAHFDTGNPFTCVSAEELIEAGLHQASLIPAHQNINQILCEVEQITCDGLVHDQVSHNTVKVVVHATAVYDWENSPLARHCKPNDCSHGLKDGLCKYRKALFGRNLIVANDLVVTISGRDARTGFRKAAGQSNAS